MNIVKCPRIRDPHLRDVVPVRGASAAGQCVLAVIGLGGSAVSIFS